MFPGPSMFLTHSHFLKQALCHTEAWGRDRERGWPEWMGSKRAGALGTQLRAARTAEKQADQNTHNVREHQDPPKPIPEKGTPPLSSLGARHAQGGRSLGLISSLCLHVCERPHVRSARAPVCLHTPGRAPPQAHPLPQRRRAAGPSPGQLCHSARRASSSRSRPAPPPACPVHHSCRLVRAPPGSPLLPPVLALPRGRSLPTLWKCRWKL